MSDKMVPLEEVCKIVCGGCTNGDPLNELEMIHTFDGILYGCKAAEIRRHFGVESSATATSRSGEHHEKVSSDSSGSGDGGGNGDGGNVTQAQASESASGRSRTL